jgi:hypothetical protein
MMQRWKGELWKAIPQRKNDSDIWIPIDWRRRLTKPNQDAAKIANLAHELAVSDVYAALFRFVDEEGKRVLHVWDRNTVNDMYAATRYDASFVLFDNPYFLEVERGNHGILSNESADKAKDAYYKDSLNFKFDRYIEWFKANSFKSFTVLITVEDWTAGAYDRDDTERLFERVKELATCYHSTRTDKVTFLIARHRDVVFPRRWRIHLITRRINARIIRVLIAILAVYISMAYAICLLSA